MRKKLIVLDDLMFEKQYFHSANIRVQIPPGMREPAICLIILTFITGGMKEYGLMDTDPSNTIETYNDLMKQLGRRQLSRDKKLRVLADKTQELKLWKERLTANQGQDRKGSGVERVPVTSPGAEAIALVNDALGKVPAKP